MSNFQSIKESLEYIDNHLDEPITFELIAEKFHFSAYYFHRMFSTIVGKTIAAHVRDRRLMQACIQLAESNRPVIDIALNCGYNSSQSFSRAFKKYFGVSPSEYRAEGYAPMAVTVDEMIRKFTNRLHGGVYLNPKIIKRDQLIIAGVSGDGYKTGEVWNAFETRHAKIPLENRLSDNGFELRLYEDDCSKVHVGYAVSSADVDEAYMVYELPASKYASFDVYVADGYDSENNAMNEWLADNPDGYTEKLFGNAHYCIEYYDERFNGNEDGSIVEIWIPIEKKS